MVWRLVTNPWYEHTGREHVVRLDRRPGEEIGPGRVLDIREAVLGFVFNERAAGRPVPFLRPADVAVSVHWAGTGPTVAEVVSAAAWLRERGLLVDGAVSGPTHCGRPMITPEGVAAVEAIRPLGEPPE